MITTERAGRRIRSSGLASVLIASLFAVVAFSGTAAASHLCGATITEDLVLDHDLDCTGVGITVNTSDVTIRLNGHTISGPGDSMDPAISGILVTGATGVSILGPGTITGFFAGVRVVTSSDLTIKGITSSESHEAGIQLESSTGVRIVENNVAGGGHDAFQLRLSHGNVIASNVATATHPSGCAINLVSSDNNLVKRNSVSDAGTSGIQLTRLGTNPPSSGNNIMENEIRDNNHGVRLFNGATDNLVRSNEIVGNTNGISFVGPVGSPEALSNLLLRNTIEENACGVKGSASELSGNRFVLNSVGDNTQGTCTE
jgi:parallel beta-helix repeat protein